MDIDRAKRRAILNSNCNDDHSTRHSRQVPQAARVGELIRLTCLYELGGETLYAMKLFKDDKEFYRYMPVSRVDDQKLVFPVEGVDVDLKRSNDKEIYLRNINKLTSGQYKCQISVEGTFESMSAIRRLDIRDKLPPENLVNSNIAGVNSGYLVTPNLNRQQQQRHAIQQQHLKQQSRHHQSAAASMPQQASTHKHIQPSSSSTSSSLPISVNLLLVSIIASASFTWKYFKLNRLATS